eukprot:TRINITY_DN18354_c0_g1_i2.p2 TRINITY_DN18354_c0_g1~~TRINITY_DN18354_c0_g1_i2.p2  ORF type:complete len:268 (+),score=96.98 TRINITY_DN18354_c0_g1_i2:64-804(+)
MVRAVLVVVLGWCTSAVATPGYGSYCNDGSQDTLFNSSEWAKRPTCGMMDVQNLENYFTRSANYTEEYQVVDLSEPQYDELFCCMTNYTTMIPKSTTVFALDEKARLYQEAAERVLARFNCDGFYPYFNCTPCQYAYRSWVCGVMFPRACADDAKRGVFGHTQKVCKDVCYEVMRKCPVELEFHCPTDDSYGTWGTPSDWDAEALGPYPGDCNPMDYNIDAAGGPPAAALGVAALLALLVVAEAVE